MTDPLKVAFAVPGDIASPTGGYAYARALLAEWPALGVEAEHLVLPAGFPDPSPEDIAGTERLLARVAPDRVLLIDGLAYGAFPSALTGAIRNPVVALVHHPLALETGISRERSDALKHLETNALALARKVVATSPTTARTLLAEFGVPGEKLSVAEPGTAPAPRSPGTGHPGALLAVGAVSPRKGYEVLIEALAPLAALDWRLTIVGSLDRDRAAAESLATRIGQAGLAERVTLAGAVGEAELAEAYGRADILVSASLFEGYGMVLAEGLSRGLPIVAATGGATGETVPDGAGIKVPGGDAMALSAALRRMIAEPQTRRAAADAAFAAGAKLPRWSDTARIVAEALAGAR